MGYMETRRFQRCDTNFKLQLDLTEGMCEVEIPVVFVYQVVLA